MCGVKRSKVRPRGLQTECNIATAAYISYTGLVVPAAMACHTSTGFSYITSPHLLAAGCGFPALVFALL